MEVISRAEEYLNYALKNQEDYPEPISRMDYYLLSLAQEVRSGSVDKDAIKEAVSEYLAENSLQNKQIDYCQLGFDSGITQISTVETLIPFTTCSGNMTLNSDGTVTLTKGKTYKLSCYFRIDDTDALKSVSIKQNETFLFNVVAKASSITETCTNIYLFTPTEDCKVGLYTPSYDTQLPTLTSAAFYNNTKLVVEEIVTQILKQE